MLEVKNLSIDLGEFKLINVSLQVREGEYFVVLGPTGAGKTVLAECIAGIHRPQKGEIFLRGERIDHLKPEERGIGYVPQDYALFPHMTVRDNISFGLRIRKRDPAETERITQELADWLGIKHLLHRYPNTLSGGEKQRVALARALAIKPRLMLMDEPLAALDEQTREELCLELRRIHRETGMTVIHISHNLEETFTLADRICILNEGKVEAVGEPGSLLRYPPNRFVASFLRTANIFKGMVVYNQGTYEFHTNGWVLQVPYDKEGEFYATIRPEEVRIFTDDADLPSHNLLKGEVLHIMDQGHFYKVVLEANGSRLISLITRPQLYSLQLREGQEVFAYLAPSCLHIFEEKEVSYEPK